MFTYDVLLESYFTIDKQCKSPFSSDNNHIGTQKASIIKQTVELYQWLLTSVLALSAVDHGFESWSDQTVSVVIG
jgi:metal-dependent HD superfamily phosphatase/phosphodiesterase